MPFGFPPESMFTFTGIPTSCGQQATEAWQEDLEAILPDVPFIGITLTMPMEFRALLQQNRHLLHGVPAMERKQ